jgi:hypothetical protein
MSKHPLLTGHTRRAPFVEIGYTESFMERDSLTKGMKQTIQNMGQ